MVKRIIKIFFYFLVEAAFSFLKFFLRQDSLYKQGKTIVIVKPDALGDYILFRSFIPEVLNDYPNIILIGNRAWMDIAKGFDEDLFVKKIYIDRSQFFKNFKYRLSILIQLYRLGTVDLLVYPCFSREGKRIEDICSIILAKEKVAWFGDTANQSAGEQRSTAKIYTRLLSSAKSIEFEFKRNQAFFSELLGRELNYPTAPMLPVNNIKKPELPERYVLLFIGASAEFRQWSIEKFAQVADFVRIEYNFDVVIGGGPSDRVKAEELSAKLGHNCINFAGKTTLTELVSLIEHSEMLISNETGIPHIAVALGHRNIFVVSNGNHYGRFTPYPSDVFQKYHAIYPETLLRVESEEERVRGYGQGSDLDINNVSARAVTDLIKHKFTR